jgi:hypothetical protein
MSKLIAPIQPKWLYRSDEVAHIYKLSAILTATVQTSTEVQQIENNL